MTSETFGDLMMPFKIFDEILRKLTPLHKGKTIFGSKSQRHERVLPYCVQSQMVRLRGIPQHAWLVMLMLPTGPHGSHI